MLSRLRHPRNNLSQHLLNTGEREQKWVMCQEKPSKLYLIPAGLHKDVLHAIVNIVCIVTLSPRLSRYCWTFSSWRNKGSRQHYYWRFNVVLTDSRILGRTPILGCIDVSVDIRHIRGWANIENNRKQNQQWKNKSGAVYKWRDIWRKPVIQSDLLKGCHALCCVWVLRWKAVSLYCPDCVSVTTDSWG